MNNNTITRSAIHLYAHALRQNRATIIDEYTRLLETELGRMFPALKEKSEDGVQDWAYDILDCDSKHEVDVTLDRISDILMQQVDDTRICKICGKYNTDIDDLFGQNHIRCVQNETIHELKLHELQKQITMSQNTLNDIKSMISSYNNKEC